MVHNTNFQLCIVQGGKTPQKGIWEAQSAYMSSKQLMYVSFYVFVILWLFFNLNFTKSNLIFDIYQWQILPLNPKGGDISPIDDLIFWSAVCDEVMVVKP